MAQTIDGRYVLNTCLGDGGFGEVWEATDLQDGSIVAIKLLKDNNFEDRFRNEAKAALALNGNEYFPRVFRYGRDGGTLYIAMERLFGKDLSVFLEENGGRLEPKLAAEIVIQACTGMCAAHRAKIVHRDIKPENLFIIDNAGGGVLSVKILDLGIAKFKLDTLGQSLSPPLSGPGVILGTPSYMSPEQVYQPLSVDDRTDVWSLGAVLYHLLSGELPRQVEPNREALIAETYVPPRPLKEIAPWVPEALALITHHALETRLRNRKDGANTQAQKLDYRYDSAEAMLEALKAFLYADSRTKNVEQKQMDTRETESFGTVCLRFQDEFKDASRYVFERFYTAMNVPDEASLDPQKNTGQQVVTEIVKWARTTYGEATKKGKAEADAFQHRFVDAMVQSRRP